MATFDHDISMARLERVVVNAIGTGVGLAVLAIGVTTPAYAQYTISRFTIAGGGSTRDLGGPYTLGATIGQAMAGQLTGGGYSLGSGFFPGGGGGVMAIAPDDTEPEGAIPLAFRLYPTAPNPLVVGRTTVAFDLPQSGAVRVLMYDVAGRLTRTLVDGTLPAGQHRQAWDGTGDDGHRVAAGIYFLHVNTEKLRAQQKIVVLK